MPDDIDLPKVPKQWIVNVCVAVLGDEFRAWVNHQVQERNAVMCEKKEMMISIDPEMAAKFAASTHVSRKYASVCPDGLVKASALTFAHPFSHQGCVRQHAQDQLQA